MATFDILDLSDLSAALGPVLTPSRGGPHISVSGTSIRYYSDDTVVSRLVSNGTAIPQTSTFQFEFTPVVLPPVLADMSNAFMFFALHDISGDMFGLSIAADGITFTIQEGSMSLPVPSSVLFSAGTRYTIRIVLDGVNRVVDLYVTESAQIGVTGHVLRYSSASETTPVSYSDGFTLSVVGAALSATEVMLHTLHVSSSLMIPNKRPIALAPDTEGSTGKSVALDGSGSYDPENMPITYEWALASAPAGSSISDVSLFPTHNLSSSTEVDAAGGSGVFVAGEFVKGSTSCTSGRFVSELGGKLYLTSVTDPFTPGEDILGESGAVRTIGTPTNQTYPGKYDRDPAFIPDKDGEYIFSLVVNDGALDSVADAVSVVVSTSSVSSGYVPEADFMWQLLGNVWDGVEGKDAVVVFWSALMQLASADMLTAYQHDRDKSIGTIGRRLQRKWLDYDCKVSLEDETFAYSRATAVSSATGAISQAAGTDMVAVGTEFVTSATGTFLDNNIAVGAILNIDSPAMTATVVNVISNIALQLDKPIPPNAGLVYRVGDLSVLTDASIANFLLAGISRGQIIRMTTVGGVCARQVLDVSPSTIQLNSPLPTNCVGVIWDTSAARASFGFAVPNDLRLFSGDITLWSAINKNTQEETQLFVYANGASGDSIGVTYDASLDALLQDSAYDVTLTHLLRASRVPVAPDTSSIPRLQSVIKDPPASDVLLENRDFSLEDSDEGKYIQIAVPYSTTLLPPDTLWAEYAHLSNSPTIEANFGYEIGLPKDSPVVEVLGLDYLSSVRGLLYCYLFGPSVENLHRGVQIFCGLPFSYAEGTIVRIESSFTSSTGQIAIQDKNSTKIRTYTYKRSLGIATNPTTNSTYAVGDTVSVYAPLSNGVEIIDRLIDDIWWKKAGLSEIEKYFTFMVGIEVDAIEDRTLIVEFITEVVNYVRRVKPVYTDIVAMLRQTLVDTISVTEVLSAVLMVKFTEKICTDSRVGMYGEVDSLGVQIWQYGASLAWGYADRICPSESILVTGTQLTSGVPQYGSVHKYGDPIQYNVVATGPFTTVFYP